MPDNKACNIKIAALCGSLSENSSTGRALRVALASAAATGAQTQLIDLRAYHLPFAGQHDAAGYPDVARLAGELGSAQGILIGTPEYHGSFSGVLKNALDLMGFAEFEGKMIGLIGVGGGSFGAINSLTHLRGVGRQLRAWVLPQQVSIARAWDAFRPDGSLKNPDDEVRLKAIGLEVARFAHLHSTAAEEFLRGWEKAAGNTGID